MTGRRLVLLRHGRTPWNHEGRIQGQQDVGLDEVGRAQAAQVAPVVADLRPALLWASDLGRARETASYVADACGLPVVHDPRLREFSFGERETMTHVELGAVAPAELDALRRGDFDRIPAAEPTLAVQERMCAVIADLREALAPAQTGVAVSHGAAIRVATGALLGWPEGLFHTLRGLDNCATVVLEEDADGGPWRLVAYNRGVLAAA